MIEVRVRIESIPSPDRLQSPEERELTGAYVVSVECEGAVIAVGRSTSLRVSAEIAHQKFEHFVRCASDALKRLA